VASWLKLLPDLIRDFGPILLRENGNPTALGLELSTSYRKVLTTSPKEGREDAVEALERVWHQLGRDLGAIPWTKGGPITLLSNEFQARLLVEAQGLVAEVRDWTSPPEDLDWIRSMVPVKEVQLLPQILSLVEEEEKRGKSERAEELRKKYSTYQQEALDKAQDVEKWLLQIDFPMLSAEELQKLLDDPPPRSTLRPAGELVGSRLGMAGSTIENNTRPYRKK
jgi:hypothetical protein